MSEICQIELIKIPIKSYKEFQMRI